jgi:hypothetical protein
VQDTAEAGRVTVPRRSDRLLGRRGEPVQPYLKERYGAGVAMPVPGSGQRGATGRPHFGNDRAGRPADLGRGRRRPGFNAGQRVQLEQVRLAPRLMLVYLIVGSHGSSAPLMSMDA